MKFIKEMFSEDNGRPSSIRFLIFIVVCTILFNWTYHNITQNVLAPLNLGEIGAIVGSLIVKAYQKDKEEKRNET